MSSGLLVINGTYLLVKEELLDEIATRIVQMW